MSAESTSTQTALRLDFSEDFGAAIGHQVGPYVLKKLIGVGGMGAVFLAVHEKLNKRVALKLLKKSYRDEPEVQERFLTEAKSAAESGHENIISVFDVIGDSPLGPYMVMEYLENAESLGKLISREAPLSIARVRRIAVQIADALAAAHARGVVHCDLKPSNILMIRAYGQDDVVKLIDFGIAQMVETGASNATASTQYAKVVHGTPKYMSPEQVIGKPLDGRSDEYALGVLVYQMLTGAVPFLGATPLEIMRKQYQEMPVSPRVKRPELSLQAEEVILRALEKNPDARFPSIKSFGAALDSSLEEPVTTLSAQSWSSESPTGGDLAGGWENGVRGASQQSVPVVTAPSIVSVPSAQHRTVERVSTSALESQVVPPPLPKSHRSAAVREESAGNSFLSYLLLVLVAAAIGVWAYLSGYTTGAPSPKTSNTISLPASTTVAPVISAPNKILETKPLKKKPTDSKNKPQKKSPTSQTTSSSQESE